MTTTVVRLPAPDSMTAVVAGEVRAELARARLAIANLPKLIGGSYSYWQRRVSGVTPFDVEDLHTLGQLLGCEAADFMPARLDSKSGPNGDGTWAPSGSNRRPTDYKSAPCQVLEFPPARPALAPIIQLPRRQLARAS